MNEAEANREAPYWMSYARSLSHHFYVPPLYTQEDWEAEAYLGLAVALRHLEPRGPRPTYAPFIKTVVINHLSKVIKSVLMRPLDGGNAGPPRAAFGRAQSLDVALDFNDGEGGTRHDIVPDVRSPDPLNEAIGSAMMDRVHALKPYLNDTELESLDDLLAGVEVEDAARARGHSVSAAENRRYRIRALLRYVLRQEGYDVPEPLPTRPGVQ